MVYMRWADLADGGNGMREILIIMLIEWLLVLAIAYIDKIVSSGSVKGPVFFLQNFKKNPHSSSQRPSLRRQESKVFVEIDKPDVVQEREKVEQLLHEPNTSYVSLDLVSPYSPTDDESSSSASAASRASHGNV